MWPRQSFDVPGAGPGPVPSTVHVVSEVMKPGTSQTTSVIEQTPSGSAEFFDPDRHGDEDTAPGVIDFAVNVRPGPPEFLVSALRDRIADLGRYPSAADLTAATSAVARLHGRDRSEVLLLGGAAEGFELLAKLAPKHVALVQPSFTEPQRVLRAAGARISQVILTDPWSLADVHVPDDADMVVVGNPTNPTSVLHTRAHIDSLRRPGRTVVIDEAFADLTLDPVTGAHEPQSLAGERSDDLIVVRSITKTFALAGLRAGYLLASPAIIARLSTGRRHWPLGTLALVALAVCAGDEGQAYARAQSEAVAAHRAYLSTRLAECGWPPAADAAASYVLIRVPNALQVKERLRHRGIGVRSCANFVGLGPDHLRIAVRSPELTDVLVGALQDVMAENAPPFTRQSRESEAT